MLPPLQLVLCVGIAGFILFAMSLSAGRVNPWLSASDDFHQKAQVAGVVAFLGTVLVLWAAFVGPFVTP